MEWYEIAIGLIVALGGLTSAAQLVKAVREWRSGVAQREAAPTVKLVAYLDARVTALEAKVDNAELYIDLLIADAAAAGRPVPPRPAYGGAATI